MQPVYWKLFDVDGCAATRESIVVISHVNFQSSFLITTYYFETIDNKKRWNL